MVPAAWRKIMLMTSNPLRLQTHSPLQAMTQGPELLPLHAGPAR